jgi:signal recognition particle receptor subunit beta
MLIDDVLPLILSYLPWLERMSILRFVSKSWNTAYKQLYDSHSRKEDLEINQAKKKYTVTLLWNYIQNQNQELLYSFVNIQKLEQQLESKSSWFQWFFKSKTSDTSEYIFSKVIIAGGSMSGKSYLRQAFQDRKLQCGSEYLQTIGVDFGSCHHTIEKYKNKIIFHEISGDARFQLVSNRFWNNCQIVLLCFDITNSSSFTKVITNLINVKKQQPIIIIGLKSDLNNNRQVTIDEANQYAGSIGAIYTEASSHSYTNIEELLTFITCFTLCQKRMKS